MGEETTLVPAGDQENQMEIEKTVQFERTIIGENGSDPPQAEQISKPSTPEPVAAPPAPAPAPAPASILAPAPIRPSLRGTFTRTDDGTGKWEGRWGMDDNAFQPGGITSPFTYTSENADLEEAAGNSHGVGASYFTGHFMMGSVSGKPPTKHVEKDVLFKFTDDSSLGEGRLKVLGEGSNQFGSFSLDGTYSVESGELICYRTYTGPPQKKSAARRGGSKRGAGARQKRPRPTATAPSGKTPSGKRVTAAKNVSAIPSAGSTNVSERTGRIRRTPSHFLEDTLDAPSATGDLADMKIIIQNLLSQDKEGWFSVPVDAEALGLTNYHQIITNPMDIGTIKTKFETNQYTTQDEVVNDIRLVFSNATLFNPKGHPVNRVAAQHLKIFESEYKKLVRKQNSKAKKTKKAVKVDKPKVEKEKQPTSGSGGDGRRKRPGAQNGSSKSKKSVKQNIFSSSDDDDDDEEDEESDDDYERERKKRKKQKKKEKPKKESRKSKSRSEEPAEMKVLRKQVEMMNKQIEMMQQMQQQSMMNMMQMNQQQVAAPEKVRSPAATAPPKKKEVPLSYQEKRQLGQDIHKLPGDKIGGVISIIEESGAPMGQEGDEVELDIEALDTPALRRLQVYVRKALKRSNKNRNVDSLVM